MIVVDASVIAVALGDDGADGDHVRQTLAAAGGLHAPELLDAEVLSVWRRLAAAGQLPVRRAELALTDLVELPLQRYPHRPLLARAWQLRDNLTAYDALYVTLAELLGCELVTGDARLARAPGLPCSVTVVPPGT